MPRINEHKFELNNEEYLLTWYDKPRLTRGGVELKVLPILREYILKMNLPLLLFNSKGNKEVTNIVAKKILEHFSQGNSNKKSIISNTLTLKTKSKNIKEKPHKTNDTKKISANEKIDDLLKSFDWQKIKDKKIQKLLIIGCSDSKTPGGNNQIRNYFDDVQYDNLLNDRITNLNNYNLLFQAVPNYFIYKNNNSNNPIKRNNLPVADNYFSNCINENLLKPAIERYEGGKFYKAEHLRLYREKNKSSNLHILIISALYGVIEFRDSIIDYHLEMSKIRFWPRNNNTSINSAVKKYIKENNIDNEMVFYSLSKGGTFSYTRALKPSEPWKNIWIEHDRGDTSARFIKDHFLPNL